MSFDSVARFSELDRPATVLVFIKFPAAGKVKTRLAATLGFEKAASLYRDWIGHVLERLQPMRQRMKIIGCVTGAEVEQFSPWKHWVDEWWLQGEGDLGSRLDRAFARGLVSGSVLAVGTDCLDLEADHLATALEALDRVDAAFGPTSDGGYYLIALGSPLPGIFDGIRWSTKHTLADHLAKCSANGWRTAFLPTLQDIDTIFEWNDYCRRRVSQ